jgi:site-specific DNA recombinase
VTSGAWQREMAEAVIADRGVIVVDFSDLGCSRRVPWERRGEAVALLEQARLADRRFDAVVVGEFGRAFTDRHDLERNRRRSGALLPRSLTR